MGTSIRTTVLALAGCAIAVSAAAQTPISSGVSALDAALSRSVCERVQAPLAFSTRDSAFALSLPQDEPATIFLQVTVGKNGKVKEKLTRVDANHLAGYVAPAFLAATKDLRIDRSLLGNLSGKDTSLTLAFPLEYQCVYDTITKVLPDEYLTEILSTPLYRTTGYQGRAPMSMEERERRLETRLAVYPSIMDERYAHTGSTRVWYYLAFIKNQEE